jgi:hypothetical protein
MAESSEISLTCAIAGHVSMVFHQNAVPLVQEISIQNGRDRDLVDVVVRLSSEPAVMQQATLRIDRIPIDSTHHIRTPDVRLDPALLRTLTEGIKAEIRVAVEDAGKEIINELLALNVLPPSHWGGTGAVPELLAAFVWPNDPAVEAVLREAATKLESAGRDASIDGYRLGRKARSWEIAEAIWAALASHGIKYIVPPASFERSGQKVRSPGDIFDRKLATCLDLTLFYAACLEQAGLNPVVVLTEGHAFLGLWLKDETFSTPIIDDVQVLRKRRDLEDAIFIETTTLTQSPPARFRTAVRRGSALVEEGAEAALEIAIDVRRARARQIRPLDLGFRSAPPSTSSETTSAFDLNLEQTPAFLEEIVVRERIEPVERLEKWKRRLLDLTLRNKLLNFKDTRKAVGIECPDPAKLEDLLSSGRRFKLLARADVLDDSDRRNSQLFQEMHQEDGRREYVLQALDRGDLHTMVTEGELDGRLTELFRVTRTAFEEGGSNVLFLILGFLKWTQKEGCAAIPCTASSNPGIAAEIQCTSWISTGPARGRVAAQPDSPGDATAGFPLRSA